MKLQHPATVTALAALLALLHVAATVPATASTGPERDGLDEQNHCYEQPERCGAGVVLGPDYNGVENCGNEPNCIAHRIVHRGSGATDYVPVPDGDDDTAATCIPRAPGRIAPAFDQTDLPGGSIGANPHHRHLTGLESWYWWQGPTTHAWQSPVAVGVTADCRVITAPAPATYTAELVGLLWHLDDGRPATYTSTSPGSEDHPAARHTYRTKGTWTVEASCVWRGHWGATTTVPCATRDIEVVEVRTHLSTD